MAGTINQRIARCRKLANLTQIEAAEKMGMKCSTYSQMERKGMISTERLLALAKIFDVEPDVLLYENDDTVEKRTLDFSAVPVQQNQFMQSETSFKTYSPAPFITSKKEENIIKIIRNMPKEVKDEIIAFIEEKYKELK